MLPRPRLRTRERCPRCLPPLASRSASANTLAVLEVGEHSAVFFNGVMHRLEMPTPFNYTISSVARPLCQRYGTWCRPRQRSGG